LTAGLLQGTPNGIPIACPTLAEHFGRLVICIGNMAPPNVKNPAAAMMGCGKPTRSY